MDIDPPPTKILTPPQVDESAVHGGSANTAESSLASMISDFAAAPGISTSTVGNILSLIIQSNPSGAAIDARLAANLRAINSHRGVSDGWDGRDAVAPNARLLDVAEMLTTLLNSSACSPLQVMIGTDGRPSFALSTAKEYLHLVVDPSAQGSNQQLANLSWYSVSGGYEEFKDEVPFDGRAIPESLRKLVQKP